jgi:hypothetical protein
MLRYRLGRTDLMIIPEGGKQKIHSYIQDGGPAAIGKPFVCNHRSQHIPASSTSARPVSSISNGMFSGLIAELTSAELMASAYSSNPGSCVCHPNNTPPSGCSLRQSLLPYLYNSVHGRISLPGLRQVRQVLMLPGGMRPRISI